MHLDRKFGKTIFRVFLHRKENRCFHKINQHSSKPINSSILPHKIIKLVHNASNQSRNLSINYPIQSKLLSKNLMIIQMM